MNPTRCVTPGKAYRLLPSRLILMALIVGSCISGEAGAVDSVTSPDNNPAVVPAAPRKPFYVEKFKGYNARVRQGNVDMVFIGDSITDFWHKQGKEVWAKHYAKRNGVNLGVAGDRTQHVLWRIAHGNLDGIAPKVAVVMIGTNNASDPVAPDQIADGVKAVVNAIHAKTPNTKVLLLGIFPRGKDAADPKRKKNEKVNQIISGFGDGMKIFYMDIGSEFLEPDGSLTKETTLDFLHLKPKGYRIWAEAIEPKIKELMGEK